MTGLKLTGPKLHWQAESEKRRLVISEAIAELPLEHVVVVRTGLDGERVERRRRLCMERMMFELQARGVSTATFESRGPADDRRDRRMVDTLRARRVVTGGLRVEHERGPVEPMLWLPDAICGAVVADRIGDGRCLEAIRVGVCVDVVTV